MPHISWTWHVEEAFDLPVEYRNTFFNHLDECKAVDQGRKFLLTSSAGGVALLEKASKQILFYAHVANAHSAELLPNDRIVIAASTHEQGNRLELYDLKQSEKPLFKDSLYSGHGVVWDGDKQLLYALGYDELRAYSLLDWNTDRPKIQRRKSWKIPGVSGHDLAPVPGDKNQLLLTEHESVWIFDKTTFDFTPFDPLADKKDVKALSLHPVSGRIAYIQADTSWWSEQVYLLDPQRRISFPGIRLYKVRWLPTLP